MKGARKNPVWTVARQKTSRGSAYGEMDDPVMAVIGTEGGSQVVYMAEKTVFKVRDPKDAISRRHISHGEIAVAGCIRHAAIPCGHAFASLQVLR